MFRCLGLHHQIAPPRQIVYFSQARRVCNEGCHNFANTRAVMRCRRGQPGEGKRCSCQHLPSQRILLLNPQLSANDLIADADVRQSVLHTNGNRDVFVIWLVALRRHHFMDIIVPIINPGPCSHAVGIRSQNGNLLTVFRLGPRISPRRFHQ